MKQIINLTTMKGNALDLTVEAYSGMIHLTSTINGSAYYLLRLPQELKRWPINDNGTLRMNANSGNDFGGQLIAELDGESAQRLDAIIDEASRRVNEAREYEEAMSEEKSRRLLAQLQAEVEADAAPYEPDPDFNLFDD